MTLPIVNEDNTVDLYTQPSRTYRIIDDRISGFIDGQEAILQSVYKILTTERYQYIIYNWDYGVEFQKQIGRDSNLVAGNLPALIIECLKTDDRILDVFNFNISKSSSDSLLISFELKTTDGDISVNDFEVIV
jgi:hypothetical protein